MHKNDNQMWRILVNKRVYRVEFFIRLKGLLINMSVIHNNNLHTHKDCNFVTLF